MILVGFIIGVVLGLLYLRTRRPASIEADVPATLLWRFRVTSYGSYVLLWGGIAVFMTLLVARARKRHAAQGARATC